MEKFFLIVRSVEKRLKHEKKKRKAKRYKNTRDTKKEGRWVNALALYGEEGRDYLRKAATSWK